MSAKEKDAFYRAAAAIGRVVAAHPRLLPEDLDEHDTQDGTAAPNSSEPMRDGKGDNGGGPSAGANRPN